MRMTFDQFLFCVHLRPGDESVRQKVSDITETVVDTNHDDDRIVKLQIVIVRYIKMDGAFGYFLK